MARQGCGARASCRSPTPMSFITARSVPSRRLYLPEACGQATDIIERAGGHPRHRSCAHTARKPVFGLNFPTDRIGDIVLISSENKTLGTSEHRITIWRRSTNHCARMAGLTEQRVPFIANRKLPELLTAGSLRSFDAAFTMLWSPPRNRQAEGGCNVTKRKWNSICDMNLCGSREGR